MNLIECFLQTKHMLNLMEIKLIGQILGMQLENQLCGT